MNDGVVVAVVGVNAVKISMNINVFCRCQRSCCIAATRESCALFLICKGPPSSYYKVNYSNVVERDKTGKAHRFLRINV